MKQRIWRRVAALALAGVMVFSLTACGGRKNEEAKDTLIVEGITNGEYLSPIAETSVYDKVAVHSMFDTLVMFGEDGKIEPMLAESWDVSEDGMTYTFHIREDATFSDGSDITADAFVYCLDTIISTSWGYYLTDYIKEWKVVDDKTLEVTKTGMYSSLLNTLAESGYAIPREAREADSKAYDEEPSVVSGPYVFESKGSDGTVFLKVNEKYWGEKPGFANLEIRVPIDGATSAVAIENGELDMLTMVLQKAQVVSLEEKENVNIIGMDSSWSGMSVLLMGERLGNDINLRKAINYGISRENAIKLANEGMGTPATDVYSTGVMGEYAGKVTVRGYDEALAKECLEKSSYDGKPIKLTIFSNNALAESVQSDLKKIGIEIEIEQIDMNSWSTKLMNGEIEMTMAEMGTDSTSVVDMMQFWRSDNPIYGIHMGKNEEYDSIMNDVTGIRDQAEMDEAVARALEIADDMSSVFCLYDCVFKYAVSDKVDYDYPSSAPTCVFYLQYAKPAE